MTTNLTAAEAHATWRALSIETIEARAAGVLPSRQTLAALDRALTRWAEAAANENDATVVAIRRAAGAR